MIKKYVDNLASKIGVELTTISVVNGQFIGCLDVFLVKLIAKEGHADILIHQFEWDQIQKDISCNSLEMRIMTALTRLQMDQELQK